MSPYIIKDSKIPAGRWDPQDILKEKEKLSNLFVGLGYFIFSLFYSVKITVVKISQWIDSM